MKKVMSLCLAILLLASVIPLATAVSVSADEPEDSIVLSPSDYTITVMNNSAVIDTDGETLKLTKNYPVFRIGFPELYYLKSVKVTFTAAGYDGNIPLNSGGFKILSDGSPVTLGPNYSSVRISPNTTTQKTFTIPEDYQYTQAEGLQFALNFTSPSEDITLHIDSIVLVGAPLTETIELTGSDIVLNRINNCTVDENTVVSTASQYPQFYLDFGKDYYIRKITVTATAAGKGYSTSNDKITLRKDGEIVTALGWSYQSFAMGTTSSKTKAIAADYQTMAVNQVYFLGTWASKPGAGEATLTIESVTITVWHIPQDDIIFYEDEISITPLHEEVSVEENVITMLNGNRAPQFTVNLPGAMYAEAIDFTFNNTYDYSVTWSGNNMKLSFADGSKVTTPVSLGEGEHAYNYSHGVVRAQSITTVNIVIPEECKNKKLTAVSFMGWFNQADFGEGTVEVMDVTVYGVPNEVATGAIDQMQSPMTYANGKVIYDSFNVFYKNAIDAHTGNSDFAASLVSFGTTEDILSYWNGKLAAEVSVPHIAEMTDDYYVSELGIIGIPSSDLGENTLTLTTEGAQTVSMTFTEFDDSSSYVTFTAPFVGTEDYIGQEITVRAFVKYTDGTDEVIFYSENTDVDTGVTDGLAAAELVETTASSGTIGDCNDDTAIDILDLIRVKKALAGTASGINFIGGDVNADGMIDSTDLAVLSQYLLGTNQFAAAPYCSGFTVTGTLGVPAE